MPVISPLIYNPYFDILIDLLPLPPFFRSGGNNDCHTSDARTGHRDFGGGDGCGQAYVALTMEAVDKTMVVAFVMLGLAWQWRLWDSFSPPLRI